MTEAIVHQTKGLIDIRAFTTMGMSAKVTTNPIGMFGTGLKYAIAVLVRLGARPVVWIGRDRYEFFCESTDFRGKEFQLVRMKRKRWSLTKASTHDLPFTTEYGRNWKPWQAFRELEANTRDEDGETWLADLEAGEAEGRDGLTTIVIDHPEYVAAWRDQDSIFLPDGLKDREGSEGLQVLEGESNHIYYRGMRALDLNKPTRFTYNILAGVELTEDRTLKYDFQVKEQIARHLLACDDRDLIHRIMQEDEQYWENNLSFPEWAQPGQAFRDVAENRYPPRARSSYGSYRPIWRSAGSYYARHDRRPLAATEDPLDAHEGPFRLDEDQESVLDANGTEVFVRPYGYKGRWGPVAEAMLKKMGLLAPKEEPEEEEPEDEPEEPYLEVVMVPKNDEEEIEF